jgi:palmitoyltransferase
MASAAPNEKQSNRSCCAVIEEAADQAHERRFNRTKKQPWIVLKMMVFFTAGVMGYTAYVYLGRLCANMIRRIPGSGGSHATGSK